MTVAEADRALRHVLPMVFGRWWADDRVEDIFANDAGRFFVHGGGRTEEIAAPQLDARTTLGILTLAAHGRGQTINRDVPLLDCEMPDKERVAGVVAPCTPQDFPLVAIRKGNTKLIPLEDLDRQGLFSEVGRSDMLHDAKRAEARAMRDRREFVGLFRFAVANRWSIAFVGQTGSGKNVDMNSCLLAIAETERLIFIGDTDEVPRGLPHRNVAILLSGKHGGVGQGALVAQALRMKPRWKIVLEIRDGDGGWATLRALGSGHPGIMSWHAPSARRAFASAAAMMREQAAAAGMREEDLISRMRNAIDVVCHVQRNDRGEFRATEILFGEEVGAC